VPPSILRALRALDAACDAVSAAIAALQVLLLLLRAHSQWRMYVLSLLGVLLPPPPLLLLCCRCLYLLQLNLSPHVCFLGAPQRLSSI
jgi:hypothetical protein